MCAFVPLMLASTAISAAGSIMQGNQAAAAGEAQRGAYMQQAERERQASSYEASRVAEAGRRNQSTALTQIAGSGVTLAGSPTEVLADNAKATQMDIDAVLFNSGIRQSTARTQGDLAAFTGQQRQTAGYIGAASNVASGLSALYNPRNAVTMGGSNFPASVMS